MQEHETCSVEGTGNETVQEELPSFVGNLCALQWGSPHVDLFATSLNYKLQVFVSPVPDPKTYAVDAMSFPWEGMFAYAFPPFRFLSMKNFALELGKKIVSYW
jgi:hypothetical protein